MNTRHLLTLSLLALVSLPVAGQGVASPPPPAYGQMGRPLAPPPWQGVRLHQGVHLTRSIAEDGSYLIQVWLSGLAASQVQIRAGRGRLQIRITQRERAGGPYPGGGWQGGSAINLQRSLPLPPDADVGHITTRETPEGVEIRIPRRP